MNEGSGIGGTVVLLAVIFPVVAFILIFGELMVIRKHQKKMMELLRRAFPRETADADGADDDSAI